MFEQPDNTKRFKAKFDLLDAVTTGFDVSPSKESNSSQYAGLKYSLMYFGGQVKWSHIHHLLFSHQNILLLLILSPLSFLTSSTSFYLSHTSVLASPYHSLYDQPSADNNKP